MTAKSVFIHKPSLPQNLEPLLAWSQRRGLELVDITEAHTSKELIELSNQHKPLALINSNGFSNVGGLSDEVVAGLPSSVKAICNFSAGYDNLGDLARLREKNIQASNTPRGVGQSTADTGLYLILGALRNFGQMASNLREGKFLDGIPLADEYDNKTLGIVGLGGIGSLLRDKIVGCFNFSKIQYYNRHRASPEREKGATYVSFDELLRTSDVIVLIIPLNSETRHLMNRDTLSKVKKGAVLVNIGRGPLIDEDALAEALESGHLGSVGLDVYENEPKIHPKLLKSVNTLLLPHAGTHSVVARHKMLEEVVENLESLLASGKVSTPVPELRDLHT